MSQMYTDKDIQYQPTYEKCNLSVQGLLTWNNLFIHEEVVKSQGDLSLLKKNS